MINFRIKRARKNKIAKKGEKEIVQDIFTKNTSQKMKTRENIQN